MYKKPLAESYRHVALTMSHIAGHLHDNGSALGVITDLRMDIDHSVNTHIIRPRRNFDPETAEYLARIVERLERRQQSIDELGKFATHMVLAFFEPRSPEFIQELAAVYDRIQASGGGYDWHLLVAAIVKDPRLKDELERQTEHSGDDDV